MHDVDGVRRFGAVASGLAVEVEVAAGDELDPASRRGGAAALVGLAPGDLKGMLLVREGPIDPTLDRAKQQQPAATQVSVQ